MRFSLVIGLLASYLAVTFARYKSTDFTDKGKLALVFYLDVVLHALIL